MVIFTSICANYAHKARTLAQSVRRFLPEAKFYVCLTERTIPETMLGDNCFDRIILSSEMWEGNFDRFIFKYSIVEASTAVKGQFFRYLFKTCPEEDCFVYLDPDCCVYGDFSELREALTEAPIVLCPHLLHPGNIDMELSSTAHGVYNLGFLAVTNTPEAFKMIDWWAERLYLYCYDDIANGIFTDQKWIDLVPCFFPVKIMHHYGYDFAPWGLLGCRIEKQGNDYFVQGQPVKFVHFSGFGEVAESCMDKWLGEDAQAFREMYADYAVQHENNDQDRISSTPWSYGTYRDGTPISAEVRSAYRTDWDLMFSLEDPFACSESFFREHFGMTPAAGKLASVNEKKTPVWFLKKCRSALHLLRCLGFSAFWNRLREVIRGE